MFYPIPLSMIKKILLLCIVALWLQFSFASEKYSFEKAEALKPLIDWRPYSPSTFQEAKEAKKPIFMLLTAPSRCYRCQVYESEEYLFDPQMIELLNTKTIPVYVDADIRQDLTRKYLEWWRPSTTVMTPDGTRIYGYSGPRPIPNMVQNVENAWTHVQSLGTGAIARELYVPTAVPSLTDQQLISLSDRISMQASNSFDLDYGWFGTAKKFPQGRILKHFVDQYKTTKDDKRIEMVQLTLEQQYTSPDELDTNYNLYDPIEWWFHRYGTTRNRDPPHYEKMLYDNVRLLNAYHNYWTTGLDDPYLEEVMAGTWTYLIGSYYDAQDWGFFANTDVAGEDAYYAQNPRPTPSARVEKTKYTDRNADALVSLLSIRARQTEDMVYQTPTWPYTVTLQQLDTMIQDTLEYLDDEIITKQWAYHYQQPDGTTGVRGSIIDHALLSLAYIDAYTVYDDKQYLNTARDLVDYSLDNIYDRYGGGFFERNSPDTYLYALGDHVDLTKPIPENGIFAFVLTKLATITDSTIYHIAAHDTMAWMAAQPSQWRLDRWYYTMMAAQEFWQAWLLESLPSDADDIKTTQQKTSRLNGYIDGSAFSNDFELSAVWLESYTHRGFGVFALLALVAWVLSFLSPCTLPVLPAYVANVLRSEWSSTRRIIWFMIWLIGIFTVLGLSATRLGQLFHGWIEILVPLVGVMLIIVWISLIRWEEFGRMTRYMGRARAEQSSSILLGMSMWVAWTPCVGPILLSILAVAGLQSQVRQGALLLVIYGLGLSVPLLLVWRGLDRWRMSDVWVYLKGAEIELYGLRIHRNTLIAGTLLTLVWVMIVFGGLDVIAMRGTKAFGNSRLGELEQSLTR